VTTLTDHRDERGVIAYLAFLSFLLAFGIDTVLPAFDEIRSEFSLSSGSGQVSLLVTFYFFGLAVGQPLYGPVADRFGRKPVLYASLGLYTLGALGASVAPSFSWVLVARLVWGIGAAGPSVLSHAIARDLYDGDQMARVLALVMAAFLIGPTISPLIGEGLLLSGHWQAVFVAAVLLALIAVGWVRHFGETLPAENRRPLDFRSTARGYRTVFSNRSTAGYILAMVFSDGAFYVFLGSSQPIVDVIYGHKNWFALTFAAISAVNGTFIWLSSRLVARVGAAKLVRRAYLGLTATFAVLLVTTLATNGVPPFFVWVALITATSTFSTMVTTSGVSLALQPMSRLAGTAAAARGLATQGGGALLAALVDRQITNTVTPMAVGGVIFGVIGLGFLWWAEGGSLETVDPDAANPGLAARTGYQP